MKEIVIYEKLLEMQEQVSNLEKYTQKRLTEKLTII